MVLASWRPDGRVRLVCRHQQQLWGQAQLQLRRCRRHLPWTDPPPLLLLLAAPTACGGAAWWGAERAPSAVLRLLLLLSV